MKITVDTKEDSHDDIRKVIKMLQNIVGDAQEIFSNQQINSSLNVSSDSSDSPIANIFGDSSSTEQETSTSSEATPSETTSKTESEEETSESTEDLFAELFSEEELKKMDESEVKEDKEEETEEKSKGKKYDIELY